MTVTWLILGAVLLLVALGAGLWALRQRRRQVPAPPPPSRLAPAHPRFPILLAHGVLGFDELKVGNLRREYFRGIPDELRRMGAEVHLARVSPSSSITARAEQLAEAVRQIPARRVNIIAHSMGGLDARYAISRLGLSDKVASVTTIGTPHRGTPLADVGAQLLGELLALRRVLAALGVTVDAFYDLTTTRMEVFNREVPDAQGVDYTCFVAAIQSESSNIHPLLRPPHSFLRKRVGENDGLVPATSQHWGELLGSVDADHWAQIGWSKGFDAPGFYAAVLQELRGRGL